MFETRCFQIGVIGVRMSSEVDEVLEDYAALYDIFEVGEVASPALELRVFCQRKRPWSRPVFGVRGAGRETLAGSDPRAVLPEIEAAINHQVIQREGQFVQLHAGVLVREGQAVLMPADSGTGKTSLTAGLVECGWQYLSDEFALIDTRQCWAHPFPKALCVKENGLAVLDDLALGRYVVGPFMARGKHARYYVPPWRMSLQSLGSAAPVSWMFYLSRQSGQAAQLFSPTRAEAAVYAYRTGLNTLGHGPGGFATVVKLVKRCRAFQLNIGGVLETAQLLDRALRDGAELLAIEPSREQRHEQVPA